MTTSADEWSVGDECITGSYRLCMRQLGSETKEIEV